MCWTNTVGVTLHEPAINLGTALIKCVFNFAYQSISRVPSVAIGKVDWWCQSHGVLRTKATFLATRHQAARGKWRASASQVQSDGNVGKLSADSMSLSAQIMCYDLDFLTFNLHHNLISQVNKSTVLDNCLNIQTWHRKCIHAFIELQVQTSRKARNSRIHL